MTQTISILIAEREPLFRRGLATCLERDPRITIVASVSTARAAFKAVADLTPVIAIVGITLPDQPGFGPITELSFRLQTLKVIALADSAYGDVVVTALYAGAATCISKDVTEEHVLHLVRQLAEETPQIEKSTRWQAAAAMRIGGSIPAHPTTGGYAPIGRPLTCRELEIVRNISRGMTNAEIGITLGISSQTVKNHVTAILRKLSVSDRTQAVVLAMRQGWLSISDAGAEPRQLPAPATTTWGMTPRR